MSAASITPAQMAVRLVVATCLPRILDQTGSPPPIEAKPVRPNDRAKLRLNPGGDTLAYEVGDTPVLLDLDGAQATVFFAGGDCDAAAALLDAQLRAAYPTLRMTRDEPHPRSGQGRFRLYEGFLSEARHCKIEVDIPGPAGPGGEERVFAVRIGAGKRVAGQPGRAAPPQAAAPAMQAPQPRAPAAAPSLEPPPPEPDKKKKKGWF